MSYRRPDEFDATVPALEDGELLSGRYRMVRLLDRGGMGIVWVAEDTHRDGAQVAIKLLPAVLSRNARAVSRFRREAETCLKLTHPHIIRLYNSEQDAARGGLVYLVMQLVEGRTLENLLAEQEQGMALDRVQRWSEQLGSAIDYAHENDILHRDIKPSNIIIDGDDNAFLIDFGIAREVRDETTRVTGQDSSGTLLYMSPQQVMGENSTSNDIYSLAATLYEALSGEPPFHSGGVYEQIQHKPASALPNQPDHVNAALLAGLAKQPDDRPGTAQLLVEMLHGRSRPGIAVCRDEETEDSHRSDDEVGHDRHEHSGRVRKNRWYEIGAVAVGIILVATGVWVGNGSRRIPSDRMRQTKRSQIRRIADEVSRISSAIKLTTNIDADALPQGSLELVEELDEAALALRAFSLEFESLADELDSRPSEDGLRRQEFDERLGGLKSMLLHGQDLETAMEVVYKKRRSLDRVIEDARREGIAANEHRRALTGILEDVLAPVRRWDERLSNVHLDSPSDRLGRLHGRLVALHQDVRLVHDNLAVFHVRIEGMDASSASQRAANESVLDEALRGIVARGANGRPWRETESELEQVFDEFSRLALQARATTTSRSYERLAAQEATEPAVPSHLARFTNSLGMEMRLIPAGEFMMGSKLSALEAVARHGLKVDKHEDERPQHQVSISQPFYLGVHEVTVGQFRRFVEATGHVTAAEREGNAWSFKDGKWQYITGLSWREPGYSQDDSHPVVFVSWNDALAFCEWLSRKEGRPYRLPTEAEWEYAARGGSTTVYWWGDEMDSTGKVANVSNSVRRNAKEPNIVMPMSDGYTYTAPVGSYRTNAFGLHDMIGNTWEWCSDWYGPYEDGSITDPSGPAGGVCRVLRGGSWGDTPYSCRCSYRLRYTPTLLDSCTGFRIALGT